MGQNSSKETSNIIINPRTSSALIPTFYTTPLTPFSEPKFDLKLIFTYFQCVYDQFIYVIAPWEQQLCAKMKNEDAINGDWYSYITTNPEQIIDMMAKSPYHLPPALSDQPIFSKFTLKSTSTTSTTNFDHNNNDLHFITMMSAMNPVKLLNWDNRTRALLHALDYPYNQTHLRMTMEVFQTLDNLHPDIILPILINNVIEPINTTYNYSNHCDEKENNNTSSSTTTTTSSQTTRKSTSNNNNNNIHMFEIGLVNQDSFVQQFLPSYLSTRNDTNQIFQHVPFTFIILDLTNGHIGDPRLYPDHPHSIYSTPTNPNNRGATTIPTTITMNHQNIDFNRDLHGDLQPIVLYCSQLTQLINAGCIYPLHTKPVHIVKIGLELLDQHQYQDHMVYDIFNSYGLNIDLITFHDLNRTSTHIDILKCFINIMHTEFAKIIQSPHKSITNELLAIQYQSQLQQQSIKLSIPTSFPPPPLPMFITLNNYNIVTSSMFNLPINNAYLMSLLPNYHQGWNSLYNNPNLIQYLKGLIGSRCLIDIPKNYQQLFLKAYELRKNGTLLQNQPNNNNKIIFKPSYIPQLYQPYQFQPESASISLSLAKLTPHSQSNSIQQASPNPLQIPYWKECDLLLQSTSNCIPSLFQYKCNNQGENQHNKQQQQQPTYLYNHTLPHTISFPIYCGQLIDGRFNDDPGGIGLDVYIDPHILFLEQINNMICDKKIDNTAPTTTHVTPRTPYVIETINNGKQAMQFKSYQLNGFEMSLNDLFPSNIIQDITNNAVQKVTTYCDSKKNENDQSTTPSTTTTSLATTTAINPKTTQCTILNRFISAGWVTDDQHDLLYQQLQLLPKPFHYLSLWFTISIESQSYAVLKMLLEWEHYETMFGSCILDLDYLLPNNNNNNIINNSTSSSSKTSQSPPSFVLPFIVDRMRNFWGMSLIARTFTRITSTTSIPGHIFVLVPPDWCNVDCKVLNSYDITSYQSIQDILFHPIPASSRLLGIDDIIEQTQTIDCMDICYRIRSMIFKQLLFIHSMAFGQFKYEHQFGKNNNDKDNDDIIIQGGCLGLCNVITHPHLYYKIHFIQLSHGVDGVRHPDVDNINSLLYQNIIYSQELIQQLQYEAVIMRMKIISDSWNIQSNNIQP